MSRIFQVIFAIFLSVSCNFSPKQTQIEKKVYSITNPPIELKLDSFYQKYVNVNGIPIVSSWRVPDSAIQAACITIDFMTTGLPPNILAEMVKNKARLAIMARYEGTTDIPEHAHLANDTSINWDLRARGLGGDLELPLTSCAEENILCYQIDKYHAEDILIHEFAHTVHGVGILPIDSTFNNRLKLLLDSAVAQEKYANTYAKTNIYEYFAEGVQDWFNVNAESKSANGKHNFVNTREDLKNYDRPLYELLSSYFPAVDYCPSCHKRENLFRK